MNLRTTVLLVIVLVIAALTALNFSTLAAPTLISLGVTVVEAPLGLIMLALTVLLGVFFLAYVFSLQSSVLLETRRHTKELQAQRDLAERAEASRLTELRAFQEAEMQRIAARDLESRAAVLARLDQLQNDLQSKVEQSGNTLAAYIGEFEDRMERRGGMAGAALPEHASL
jgi:energy-coupling factor transporter transmembrane protein EcfT